MQWQKNVKGGEIIINKPEIVGTTFKELIEENGNQLEMYGVITQYIKDQVIAFHIDSRIHNFIVRYSIEEENNNSRIVVDIIIKWKFPMNILSIFIGKKMKKGLTEQLESEILELKRICESSQ